MLYLKSLEIEHVRCFGKKQKIDFTDTEGKIAQWTVILGDNGTGKTSILRSIVSMLPSPQRFLDKKYWYAEYESSISNEWHNAWSLKHKDGVKVSKIKLSIVESEKSFGHIDESDEIAHLSYSLGHNKSDYPPGSPMENMKTDNALLPRVYCFAYGANRKMAETSLSDDNFKNASETLFKEDALLQNSSEYFLRLDYESAKSKKGSTEKNRVKELLLQILPSGIQDIEVVKTGRLQREVQVKTDFGWIGINEVSLGYKTTIAWLVDFATKMIYYHEDSASPFDEPAILILDEIDLHMHPAWQREIIDNLTKIFSRTQFIVTAHSPLIAQAALDANLVLLKKTKTEVKVINEPNIVNSWRIDQILTSDLFGLKNSRNNQTEKILSKRRRLLLKTELDQNEKAELQKLEDKIDEIPVAETQEYIKAMEIILKSAKHLS